MVDYLEATLTVEHIEAFERHLQACPACVAYLNTYRTTRELTAAEGAVEMPDDMRQRLRALLEEQFRRGSGA
jgi:anti-sigma factor RsiW